MTRKNSLAASMAPLDIKPNAAVAAPAPEVLAPPTDIETARKPTKVANARVGKKAVQGFFDQAVGKQLNQIALDEDTTIQALLAEAIDDLFTKRGKPPIAR